MRVPLLGPRLCKVYQSFWNDKICRVLTKPRTFLWNLSFVRVIFTFWTGAKIVWWLLITSVQCKQLLKYLYIYAQSVINKHFEFQKSECGISWSYSLFLWAATHAFQQCGILTRVDLDEHVQPPFKLRNYKCCSVSSLIVME